MNDSGGPTLAPPAAEAPGIMPAAAAAGVCGCWFLLLRVLAAVVVDWAGALVAVVVAMQSEVHLQSARQHLSMQGSATQHGA